MVFVPAAAGGATLVQSIHEYTTDGILAFASNVTAGSLLIAIARGNTAQTPTFSSSPTGTWNQAVVADGSGADGAAVYIYYTENATGGATTITNSALQSDPSLAIYEVSGVLTSASLNATATQLGSIQ